MKIHQHLPVNFSQHTHFCFMCTFLQAVSPRAMLFFVCYVHQYICVLCTGYPHIWIFWQCITWPQAAEMHCKIWRSANFGRQPCFALHIVFGKDGLGRFAFRCRVNDFLPITREDTGSLGEKARPWATFKVCCLFSLPSGSAIVSAHSFSMRQISVSVWMETGGSLLSRASSYLRH